MCCLTFFFYMSYLAFVFIECYLLNQRPSCFFLSHEIRIFIGNLGLPRTLVIRPAMTSQIVGFWRVTITASEHAENDINLCFLRDGQVNAPYCSTLLWMRKMYRGHLGPLIIFRFTIIPLLLSMAYWIPSFIDLVQGYVLGVFACCYVTHHPTLYMMQVSNVQPSCY